MGFPISKVEPDTFQQAIPFETTDLVPIGWQTYASEATRRETGQEKDEG